MERAFQVTFDLTGLNENFGGKGYFEAESLSPEFTLMTGHLDITAKGVIGPMVNAILKNFVSSQRFHFEFVRKIDACS